MRIASASDISAIVRGRRQELGLSQGEVASRAGISRRWLVGFEAAGSTHAELGTILRVLDALDMSLDAHSRTASAGTVTHSDVLGDHPGSVDLDAIIDELRRG